VTDNEAITKPASGDGTDEMDERDGVAGRPRGVDDEPSLTGQTVLVTGGAGFVGSHLVEALLGANEVRVLDDLSSGRAANVPAGAELVQGDVRDADDLGWAMDDVDVVFHQAGLVSVDQPVDRPVRSHETNVAATVDLLDRAREVDARVVVASSCAIYGDPEDVPVDETEPKTPTSPYAVDKLAIDHYTRTYADLYDLDAVGLRYFNIYGPRQAGGDYSGVVKAFLEQARAGDDRPHRPRVQRRHRTEHVDPPARRDDPRRRRIGLGHRPHRASTGRRPPQQGRSGADADGTRLRTDRFAGGRSGDACRVEPTLESCFEQQPAHHISGRPACLTSGSC